MSELTPAALSWLATHHGVITTAQLRDHGVGHKTQVRLVDRGVLRAVHKGVFVVASTAPTLEQRCVALCCAHPGGFITGPTAGALLGLRRMPANSALHFSLRHGARVPPVAGVRFRQTTALRAGDRVRRPDGIAIASWVRLAFDLAADLSALDHLSVLHQLLHERRVTAAELAAVERRLGHAARRGSGVFRRNLHRLGDGPPNESHPEVVLAEALRARNVPVEHQTRLVRTSTGRIARVDLSVPEIRWGVELDIHPEHRTFEGHANDARRRRDLHLLEWQIEPVTEADMRHVDAIATELTALYHARRRAFDDHRRVS
jgi:hypothetical protein